MRSKRKGLPVRSRPLEKLREEGRTGLFLSNFPSILRISN
jgi:hypothetical protein